MPSFTKQQMLKELATIFLFEADHIILGSGREMAEQFIGFETNEGEYCHERPEKVDISRFNISGSFERGYEFAFEPSLLNSIGEDEIQNLDVFMQGVPRAGGVLSGGETDTFMTPDGYCQSVADAVHARWKLEWDPMGVGSHEFTPRELALLANMKEGAVRNAVADKSEYGIKPIEGSKNPVKFSHDEAIRWLSARRGFAPTPKGVKDDATLHEQLKKTESAKALGKLLQSIVASFPELKVPATVDLQSWLDGSFQFDQHEAAGIAVGLEIDVPIFVGKALELTLRRDSF